MSPEDVARARSFSLIGHAGDGKTTLADSIVMAGGVTNRLGNVEDGSSYMNYLPEERNRRASISTSISVFEQGDHFYSVLDTPGDANFVGEVAGALQAADHAVLVLSAQEGIRVGTRKSYQLARANGITVSAVANKMDLPRSEFDACARQLEEDLEVRVVKVHLPIGQGEAYEGYVDLLSRRAYTFSGDPAAAPQVGEVPDALSEETEAAYLAMVEAVAEADDAVLEKYLEEGELSEDEILETLKKGIRDGTLMPLLSAAAARNIGGQAVLEAAARLFPSPADVSPRTARQGDEVVELQPDPGAPLVAFVFKSIADRYAGMLSVVRVCAGTLRTDMSIMNPRSGTRERISKILRISGENTSDTKEVGPGGIAAIPKLRDTRTGDTLCDDKNPFEYPTAEPPKGVISFAIEAVNKGEEDKVFESLNRLVEEDPSLQLARDERTLEFLLTGLGQLHIEVTLEKLRRLFNVDVKLKPPKVPYLETIRGRAENVEGKLKKQSGGRGQFGVCYLTVEPAERGSGVEFCDEVVGGAIPRQFIPAVEKGVRERCTQGILAGYPVTDITIRCIDGKHHSVDSSEMAFKTAGSLGIREAVSRAQPTLLEPIMEMEVSVPDDFVGDVMGNLNSRRGRVGGVKAQGSMQSINAQVPMSEVLSYASDLTSITGGQGSFTMEFSHYQEMPKEIQEKIISDATASKEGE
jgi:elongation factor G